MKSPAQYVILLLALLSAFTLEPAKLRVREAVQALFVPVARPSRAVGGWLHDRMSPPGPADPILAGRPDTVGAWQHQYDLLRTQYAALQVQFDDLKQLSVQYADLSSDLRRNVRPAAVIGKPDPNRAVLTISTAGLKNVTEGTMVIHLGGGIVGRVTALGPGTARVLLATDPASHLLARFIRFVPRDDGGLGVARVRTNAPLVDGTGRGLVVKGLTATTVRDVVEVGDVAVLDDPAIASPVVKGLRLGTVTRVLLPKTNAGYATIELAPSADLAALREVLVVEK